MILEMRDICKDYPMGKSVAHILKNVNLDVEEGEYLAIMGPSGSGKTTLMNLIGCLDVPTSGSYLLGGRDVTTCNNKQLAEVRNKELGFVFQSFNLLPKLTALENVALPLLYGGVKKAERLERARAALETVGLSDRVDHRPDQLSGGQCQRVAIARAIVGKPKLLLAEYKNIAVRRVKLGLLLSEIGKDAKINITPDDINKAIMDEAKKYPGQEKAVFDYYLKNKEAIEALKAPVFEEKIVDHILSKAKVNEKVVSIEELYNFDEGKKPVKKAAAKKETKSEGKKDEKKETAKKTAKKSA